MLYEFEEPFVVDHSKFERAFGGHATPLGEAIGDTVRWLPRQASDRGYSSSCLESGLSERPIYIVREKRIERNTYESDGTHKIRATGYS
jgi:hypothetical protein